MPDPESITPLLAERLDISTDRAGTLLESMLQELKSRATSDGVHLSDLGTFEEEDGTLTFIPSPSLRRRVNHQFEGLSSEDLSAPPSARPEEEAPPSLRESSREEREEAEAASSDDTAAAGEPALEHEDTPDEPEGTPAEPEDSTERSIPTLAPLEDEPEDEAADMPPSDDTSEPDEAEAQPPEYEEEEEEEPVSPAGSFSLIGSILLIVILVGVGWFVFSDTNLWLSSQPSSETSETKTTQSTGPESPDSETSDDVSPGDQPDRYAGVRPGDKPDSVADAETGPWTVIVASLSSRTEAESVAAEYKANFATVQVMPATVNNATRYRVAVGRFDSEGTAQRALDANASMMPSDAWTHELP